MSTWLILGLIAAVIIAVVMAIGYFFKQKKSEEDEKEVEKGEPTGPPQRQAMRGGYYPSYGNDGASRGPDGYDVMPSDPRQYPPRYGPPQGMQMAGDYPPIDYRGSQGYRAPQRATRPEILNPEPAQGMGLKPMKTIVPRREGDVAPTYSDGSRTRIDSNPTTEQGFQSQLNDGNMSVGDYLNNRGPALEDQLRDRPQYQQQQQPQYQPPPQQQYQQQQRFADRGYTQSAPQNYAPPPPPSKPQPDSSMMQIFDAMQQPQH